MKYYKTSKFTKMISSTGFIVMTACLLIAVGAIGWFALARKNNVVEAPSENSSIQEYSKPDNSYNEIESNMPTESVEQTTDANDEVSDVPYTESQENTSVSKPQKPTFVLPITGNISKGYSDTALQYSATYGDMRLHTGVDILCENGSNIKSVGDGTVKSITDDANYGKVITIGYGDKLEVKYCGFSNINVKQNDTVAAGDIIGTSGDIPCECADQPHIHIEVLLEGNTTSPLEALDLK